MYWVNKWCKVVGIFFFCLRTLVVVVYSISSIWGEPTVIICVWGIFHQNRWMGSQTKTDGAFQVFAIKTFMWTNRWTQMRLRCPEKQCVLTVPRPLRGINIQTGVAESSCCKLLGLACLPMIYYCASTERKGRERKKKQRRHTEIFRGEVGWMINQAHRNDPVVNCCSYF